MQSFVIEIFFGHLLNRLVSKVVQSFIEMTYFRLNKTRFLWSLEKPIEEVCFVIVHTVVAEIVGPLIER